MVISDKDWNNLKIFLEKISIQENNYYLLYKTQNLISKIEKNSSNKVYVITNNAIFDDEVDYQIKGVAFTKNNANKLFEDAIKDAKIDAGLENLNAIDVSNGIEQSDEKWHYSKSDNSFELYLDGEYNSNNFSIEIKEFDINNLIDREINKDDIELEMQIKD